MSSLDDFADKIISIALSNVDHSQTVQTEIHPDIAFKYNSINLLVARRGVGKTFRVMKELIKLSQLKNCAGYTTFIYVSDKVNDATVNELIKLINLKVRQVSYEDILPVLEDIIDAKSAYEDVIRKGLQNEISDSTRIDLFSTLDLERWEDNTPHTAILLDDAINILKDAKHKKLQNLLFQNRQPRLTIFICVQDIFGVPVKIRRNCDAIWIFAGFTDKTAFGMMMSQLRLSGKLLWDEYNNLQYRDVMVITYGSEGIKIEIFAGETQIRNAIKSNFLYNVQQS
jgi:hypothetical protein